MTLPYITPPGLAPDRTDRISFAPRADAWTLWQQVEFVPKMNLIVTELAALSSVSTDLIAISEFKGYWGSLTGALAIPASVSHLGNFWMLLENVANVATEIPGTSSKWQKIKTKSELVCSPRTSNIMAVAADTGTLLDCSGTFTQTFDTGANLGNGWFAFVKNSGTGVITLQAVADTERVTNGSFTGNATGWTLGASWTYVSNQVTRSSNAASSSLEQVITGLTVGRVCYLTCATASLSGTGDKSISVVGAGTTILRETSGNDSLNVSGLTLSFIADATTMTLKFTSACTGGTVATVDGVSVMCAASGARSIDNMGSLNLYPNASGIVQNDGTNLNFIPLSGGNITLTSSQYFTAPYDGLYTSDVFAGGGGGGSGCRGAAGTSRTGGGGGAGGAHNRQAVKLFKGEKVYCTVGAGGTGAAGVATNNTAGVAGNAGGNSSFGDYCTAFGGGGGASTNAPNGSINFFGGSGGGSESAGQSGSSSNPVAGLPTPQTSYPSLSSNAGFVGIGTGGARASSASVSTGVGFSAEWGGASGATSSTNGTAGFNGAGSVFGGASGGSGGGLNTSNVESIGGYGGARGSCDALTYGNGTITGGVGRAGRTGDLNTYCGDGGGGGGSNASGAGGAGGAGGFPSSGGGGGGASLDNFLSGAGGVGGAGKIVISYGA